MKQKINKLVLFGLISLIFGIAAASQNSPKSLSFAVIGDSGDGSKEQYAISEQMVNHRHTTPFDFILMLGDNIYGGKQKYFKREFEDPYKNLLEAGVKFYAALGNHDELEVDYHINYKDFNMGGKRYYNFVKGAEGDDQLIEFFALDTNAEDSLDQAQFDWLAKALGDSKAKWKVAFMHHSLFSSGKMHPTYLTMRNQLHPIFVKYKVDLALAGHTHVYERIKPQNGVQYITEGCSGKIMRHNLARSSPLTAYGNDLEQSFLLIHVTANDLNVEAIGMDGKPFDSVTLKHE